MQHFKVAIIGSGPAGATAAYYLAKNGISTVIIEKEILPRYKTCGGGLVFRGRQLLPFDLSSVTAREFHKVEIFLGEDLKFETQKDEPTISMIMRDSFDNLIVKEAQHLGIELIEDCKLLAIAHENEHSILRTTKKTITANFIIAADGALSPTAKMAGWSKDTRTLIPALEYEVSVSPSDFERLKDQVRFDIDAIPKGYAWSFPKERHLSIGVATYRKSNINLKTFYYNYLKTLGINEVIKEEQHGFQIPVAPRTDGFVKNNVFLIGDAAGFADPITAEGISNAIYSGILVAEAIGESKLDPKKAGEIYETKLNVKLLPELKTGVWLAKWFYGNKSVRNLLLKKYGQRFSNEMANMFHGERSYPKNIKTSIAQKVKEFMF